MSATTTKTQLAEAFTRLTEGLDWLETQAGDGKARASRMRTSLHEHLNGLADDIAGKAEKCPVHERSKRNLCRECRSERIGRAPHELPDPSTLPENPIADEEDRKLGEHP